MCWCTPEIRTPNCGSLGCHPPSRFEEGRIAGLKEAIETVQGWREVNIIAFKTCKYVDPEEAEREHKNLLNLLGVIESQLRKSAGESPADIFRDMINREGRSNE